MLINKDSQTKTDIGESNGEWRLYTGEYGRHVVFAIAGVWESAEFVHYTHKKAPELYSIHECPGECGTTSEIEAMINSLMDTNEVLGEQLRMAYMNYKNPA